MDSMRMLLSFSDIMAIAVYSCATSSWRIIACSMLSTDCSARLSLHSSHTTLRRRRWSMDRFMVMRLSILCIASASWFSRDVSVSTFSRISCTTSSASHSLLSKRKADANNVGANRS